MFLNQLELFSESILKSLNRKHEMFLNYTSLFVSKDSLNLNRKHEMFLNTALFNCKSNKSFLTVNMKCF